MQNKMFAKLFSHKQVKQHIDIVTEKYTKSWFESSATVCESVWLEEQRRRDLIFEQDGVCTFLICPLQRA